MLDDRFFQLYRILEKHYILRMSQLEIAKEEGLSTATVSRLINKAIEKKYVSFSFNLPVLTLTEMEQTIKARYGLDAVSVARVDAIGISWGNTLSKVLEWLKPKKVENVVVVGQYDSILKNVSHTEVEKPISSFAVNEEIVLSMKSDSNIKQIFDWIDKTRILIFSVGSIRENSVFVRAGYFKNEDYDELHKRGHVGDISSQYLKKESSYKGDELYRGVIGIELSPIRKKEKRVCVALELDKAESLAGVLNGGSITSLLVDERTAMRLLELNG